MNRKTFSLIEKVAGRKSGHFRTEAGLGTLRRQAEWGLKQPVDYTKTKMNAKHNYKDALNILDGSGGKKDVIYTSKRAQANIAHPSLDRAAFSNWRKKGYDPRTGGLDIDTKVNENATKGRMASLKKDPSSRKELLTRTRADHAAHPSPGVLEKKKGAMVAKSSEINRAVESAKTKAARPGVTTSAGRVVKAGKKAGGLMGWLEKGRKALAIGTRGKVK